MVSQEELKWQTAFAVQSRKLHHILSHIGHEKLSKIMEDFDANASVFDSRDAMQEAVNVNAISEQLYYTEMKLNEINAKFEQLKQEHYTLNEQMVALNIKHETLIKEYDQLAIVNDNLSDELVAVSNENAQYDDYYSRAASVIDYITEEVNRKPVVDVIFHNEDVLANIEITLRGFKNAIRYRHRP